MIGVNCGGSVSPNMARKMITEKFGVDPDKVHKEEIDKGQFIIEYRGRPQGHLHGRARGPWLRPADELPPVQMKVPRQANLACGNWGVIGPKAGEATFIEISQRQGSGPLQQGR